MLRQAAIGVVLAASPRGRDRVIRIEHVEGETIPVGLPWD